MADAGALRIAVPADAADLARLHESLFEEAWRAETMARLLDEPDGIAIVFAPSTAAAPRAFVLARAAADEAEVLSIGVAGDAQRKGVGRALLAAAAEAARGRGAARLFLEVARSNVAARALYAKVGFVEIGTRRGYYRHPGAPPEDALLLSLDLASPRTMD